MFTYSEADYNLEKICGSLNSKYLANFKTYKYRVYGLRTAGRPHVVLTFPTKEKLVQIHELFRVSGYRLNIEVSDTVYCPDCEADHDPGNCHCGGNIHSCVFCSGVTCSIGLRRDVRASVKVAQKLIKTIMFSVESKLLLNNNSRLFLGRNVKKS